METLKKFLPITLLFGAAILGLYLLARPNDGSRVSKAQSTQLTAETSAWDFGTISMSEGKIRNSFVVTNATDALVKLSKLYTSCMCTTAEFFLGGNRFGPFGMPGHGVVPKLDVDLPAGAQARFEVTYDPAAHGPAGVGKIERVVTLEVVDGGELNFTIKGEMIP